MDKDVFRLGLLSGIICLSQLLEDLPSDDIQATVGLFKEATGEILEKETGIPAEDILTKMQPIVDQALEKIMKHGK